MQSLASVPLRLLQQLSAEEDGGGRAVSGDVVLGCGGSGDHAGGGMLDLHLVEEDIAVFGELWGANVARVASVR